MGVISYVMLSVKGHFQPAIPIDGNEAVRVNPLQQILQFKPSLPGRQC